jgi:sugar phosphate isomerase/epimerase
MTPLKEILEIAKNDGFDIVEILCEGPYWPRYVLENDKEIGIENIGKIAKSKGIELFLHGPTVDLNPGSMNRGIREETAKQTIETLDYGKKIGAKAVTIHPGLVHRKEKRIRDTATEYAIDILKSCQEHGKKIGVELCIENMPANIKFLGNTPQEHRMIVEEVGCSSTIDWGHAITCENPYEYLNTPKIRYFHLNDNDGEKDQHLNLGEGVGDFSKELLNKIDYGIIELNQYENVLKGKEYIKKQLND